MTAEVLAMILILDFSGSIDQKAKHKTKREILSDNIAALANSQDKDQKVLTISFGSNQKTRCDSVKKELLTTGNLEKWAKKQMPKDFETTPLSHAIRSMKREILEKNVDRALIITDGNDTCKQDTCEGLKYIDEALIQSKKKFRIDILGYNLDPKEKKKLACKQHRFGKLNYELHTASDEFDFEAELSKVEQKYFKDKKLQGKSGLQISGAPASLSFKAYTDPKDKENAIRWTGYFPMILAPGIYDIEAPGLPRPAVTVKLKPNQKLQLEYYRDFPVPMSEIQFEGAPLEFLAIPKDSQNRGKSVRMKVPGKFPVAAGRWLLRAIYPAWLDGKVSEGLIIEQGKSYSYQVEELFQEQIKWVSPKFEHWEKNGTVLLMESLTEKKTAFVLPTSPLIPVPLQMNYRWLSEMSEDLSDEESRKVIERIRKELR